MSQEVFEAALGTEREVSLWPLRELSARLGGNPLLVQGSNSNTSLKSGGTLWIKASGQWLAGAMREELFVAVGLACVRASVGGRNEPAPPRERECRCRPSVETAMHAMIPHRVVVHVHSIHAIAWAVRVDGRERMRERLAGLSWAWIPYAASGLPLARAIAAAVAHAPATRIFLLGNHGLVVCGDDCDEAERLLYEVEERLAIVPREYRAPNERVRDAVTRKSNWKFSETACVQALGTDPVALRILKRGILYPCQAVFLGCCIPAGTAAEIDARLGREQARDGGDSAAAIVEGGGVMVRDDLTEEAAATLVGLAEVALRIDDSGGIRYLTPPEVFDVLNKNAHGYQKSFAAAG